MMDGTKKEVLFSLHIPLFSDSLKIGINISH